MSVLVVLVLLDFIQPFIIECDASSHGFGAVLVQDWHLVSVRRPVAPRHHSLVAYERELIGLVHAILIGAYTSGVVVSMYTRTIIA